MSCPNYSFEGATKDPMKGLRSLLLCLFIYFCFHIYGCVLVYLQVVNLISLKGSVLEVHLCSKRHAPVSQLHQCMHYISKRCSVLTHASWHWFTTNLFGI